MRKLTALLALAVLASVAFTWTPAYAADITVELKAQNTSGQDGTATLSDAGENRTRVVIELENGTAEPQPAYIYKGSCSSLSVKPESPSLTSVADGKSETIFPLSLADLQKEPYSINVHKSVAEIGTYVACGEIKAAATTSGDTSGSTTTGDTGSTSGSSTTGSGNTSPGSGTTTTGNESSGNTTTSTSGTGTTNTSNMPVTGIGDDPLAAVLSLLLVGVVAIVLGRKFTRREPEIL